MSKNYIVFWLGARIGVYRGICNCLTPTNGKKIVQLAKEPN
jgi:hypothetical protein